MVTLWFIATGTLQIQKRWTGCKGNSNYFSQSLVTAKSINISKIIRKKNVCKQKAWTVIE
jgi:hypothetical protein